MDGESEKMLKDTYRLAKENNKMLLKIRRAQKVASFMRILYWLVIVGVSIGAYYLVQPFIQNTLDLVQSTGDSISNLKNSLPF